MTSQMPQSSEMHQAKLTKLERAYLAGFFDGEGCIDSYGVKSAYNPRISMWQKDRAYLMWLQQKLGFGYVVKCSTRTTSSFRIGKREDLRTFLQLIYPFLRLKKPQARLAYKMTFMTTAERKEARVILSKMKVVGEHHA